MTKEEYQQLLDSDYWKGFSYSLIKERNFTCEDCGRQFMYERNKLQVHHLVYRDINPWSYDPSEMVVLCRECHEKRHGIVPRRRVRSSRRKKRNHRRPWIVQYFLLKYRMKLFKLKLSILLVLFLAVVFALGNLFEKHNAPQESTAPQNTIKSKPKQVRRKQVVYDKTAPETSTDTCCEEECCDSSVMWDSVTNN